MARDRLHRRHPRYPATPHLRRRKRMVAPNRKARSPGHLGRTQRFVPQQHRPRRSRRRLPTLPRLRPDPNPPNHRRSRQRNASPRKRTPPLPRKKYRLLPRPRKSPRPPPLLPRKPSPKPNRPPQSHQHSRRPPSRSAKARVGARHRCARLASLCSARFPKRAPSFFCHLDRNGQHFPALAVGALAVERRDRGKTSDLPRFDGTNLHPHDSLLRKRPSPHAGRPAPASGPENPCAARSTVEKISITLSTFVNFKLCPI